MPQSEPTAIPLRTTVRITELSIEEARQLGEDLETLRAAGAPDNTAAIVSAVRDAASRVGETETRRAA